MPRLTDPGARRLAMRGLAIVGAVLVVVVAYNQIASAPTAPTESPSIATGSGSPSGPSGTASDGGQSDDPSPDGSSSPLVEGSGGPNPSSSESAGPSTGQSAGPSAGSTPRPPSPGATPGATPRPTVGPGVTPGPTVGPGGTSLRFPIMAAFYYPWFAEAWKQQGYDPFSWFTPSIGYYATKTAIKGQIAAMQAAGVEAGISSWWGQGSLTDTRVPALLTAAGTFRWSLYYEAEAYGNPTAAEIRADLSYIASQYATNNAFLRVSGKPVIFVYASGGDGCGMADRWSAANTVGFYVVLKVFPGFKACAHQPDSWHQYSPAKAADHQAGFGYAISPGFWKKTDAAPVLARDLSRWAVNVAAMKASGEPWQLITTFNEWGEGTGVESTTEYGDAFLSILGGGPVPTAAPTPAPTAAPTPVATPVATPVVTPVPSLSPGPT